MSEKFIPIESYLKKTDAVHSGSYTGFSKFPPDDVYEKSPIESPPQHHHTHSEPTITVHREGNRVSYVVLRCSCGKEYKLNCVYTVASG